MMKPMIENMLSVEPVTSRPISTPISESGSVIMMAMGWMKEPNCEARMM